MSFYKDHYKILDVIRRDRGMSVTQLCEGIIADRTYYRNLKTQENFNFETFLKLTRRLKVEPIQFVIYSVFFKDGDPGIVKFIYRVGVQYYDDIEPHYEKVKIFVSESSDYNLLLKAFMSVHEYRVNKISAVEHLEQLTNIVAQIKDFNVTNIFHLTILTFYAELNGETPYMTLGELAMYISEVDFRFSYLTALIATERMLSVLLDYAPKEKEAFAKLYKANANLIQYSSINYFHLQHKLYEAYYYLQIEDKEKSMKSLYKYAIAASAILSEESFNHANEQVNHLFACTIIDFINGQEG